GRSGPVARRIARPRRGARRHGARGGALLRFARERSGRRFAMRTSVAAAVAGAWSLALAATAAGCAPPSTSTTRPASPPPVGSLTAAPQVVAAECVALDRLLGDAEDAFVTQIDRIKHASEEAAFDAIAEAIEIAAGRLKVERPSDRALKIR